MNFPISIIVTAYNRTEFLKDALESLDRQTADHHQFEVILITNFEYDIEKYVESLNIKHYNIEGTHGEYIGKGLQESSGKIIGFLEDDDIYHKDKIKILIDMFERDIWYFKNEVKKFRNIKDLIALDFISQGTQKKEESDTIIISGDRIRCNPSMEFNLSSIAVRKDLLTPFVDILPKVVTGLDTFLWFCFLESRANGMYSYKKLNFYRVHDSISHSMNGNQSNLLPWYIRMLSFYDVVFTVFTNPKLIKLATLRVAILKTKIYLISPTNNNLDHSYSKHLLKAGLIPSKCTTGSTSLLLKYIFFRLKDIFSYRKT